MKKFTIALVLLLFLPFCTVGEESNQSENVIEDSKENNSSNENTEVVESSDSKPSDKESAKISNLREKCEIFANSKEIESDEYFFILGDDIDDRHRQSKYSHPSGAQNGPFQTWTYEDAVRISSEIIPEEFDKIYPFENDIGITWEKFEAFADALCFAYENGKGLRNVTITHADLMGRSSEILGFAGNWENFPYIETGAEVIESPSPQGLEFYTKYTTVSGVIIVGGPDAR